MTPAARTRRRCREYESERRLGPHASHRRTWPEIHRQPRHDGEAHQSRAKCDRGRRKSATQSDRPGREPRSPRVSKLLPRGAQHQRIAESASRTPPTTIPRDSAARRMRNSRQSTSAPSRETRATGRGASISPSADAVSTPATTPVNASTSGPPSDHTRRKCRSPPLRPVRARPSRTDRSGRSTPEAGGSEEVRSRIAGTKQRSPQHSEADAHLDREWDSPGHPPFHRQPRDAPHRGTRGHHEHESRLLRAVEWLARGDDAEVRNRR